MREKSQGQGFPLKDSSSRTIVILCFLVAPVSAANCEWQRYFNSSNHGCCVSEPYPLSFSYDMFLQLFSSFVVYPFAMLCHIMLAVPWSCLFGQFSIHTTICTLLVVWLFWNEISWKKAKFSFSIRYWIVRLFFYLACLYPTSQWMISPISAQCDALPLKQGVRVAMTPVMCYVAHNAQDNQITVNPHQHAVDMVLDTAAEISVISEQFYLRHLGSPPLRPVACTIFSAFQDHHRDDIIGEMSLQVTVQNGGSFIEPFVVVRSFDYPVLLSWPAIQDHKDVLGQPFVFPRRSYDSGPPGGAPCHPIQDTIIPPCCVSSVSVSTPE